MSIYSCICKRSNFSPANQILPIQNHSGSESLVPIKRKRPNVPLFSSFLSPAETSAYHMKFKSKFFSGKRKKILIYFKCMHAYTCNNKFKRRRANNKNN